MSTGRPIIFLHKSTAKSLDLTINDRAEISYKKGKIEVIEKIDNWFDGRGEIEKWEWNKLKRGLLK